MNKISVKIKEKLNANSLIELVKNNFSSLNDQRDENKSLKLSDVLMSAYAIFSLKLPSLLSFRDTFSTDKQNISSVYLISAVPSDTGMREVLDNIDYKEIQAVFPKVFHRLQRAKKMDNFRFMNDYYLVSGDGTEYFSSKTIHCKNCLQRNLRDGSIEYYHQFYGAAIVHPDIKQVVPLASEPIVRQDGNTKNDCERNASKRFLENFKKAHPKLNAIIIEDALSSNAPYIKELRRLNLHFILGVKESGHKYLFDYVNEQRQTGAVQEYTIIKGNITHVFSFINNVFLNKANEDVKINFIEYWEINITTLLSGSSICRCIRKS